VVDLRDRIDCQTAAVVGWDRPPSEVLGGWMTSVVGWATVAIATTTLTGVLFVLKRVLGSGGTRRGLRAHNRKVTQMNTPVHAGQCLDQL
jgi:hypothetical protein